MSKEGVPLRLTAEQIAKVIAEAVARAPDGELSAGLAQPRDLRNSSLMDDPRMSKTLLLGLVILIAFPADGGKRGVQEVARELDIPTSTAHRYIQTLLAVKLLAQDPYTHKYHRTYTLKKARNE
jgi:hypothetical protein